jgi:enamine deaminase RidA (YjgF/YER057c/UK114 family)
MRRTISTGTLWEERVGYSRAVVVDNQLEVTGTVAVDTSGKLVGHASMYEQTRFIFQKIAAVIDQAGFSIADVVRTRIYVTDISRWEEAGKAHQEFFGNVKPATTMVEVRALIAPEYLVEIEVSAIKSAE